MSFKHLTVRTKIFILVGVCSFSFVAYGLWSWNTLSVAKVHGPYYNRIIQGKDLIADTLPPSNNIMESYLLALEMAHEVEEGIARERIELSVKRSNQLQGKFHDRQSFWSRELADSEMKEIKTVDCYRTADDFFRVLDNDFIPACLGGDVEQAKALSRGELRRLYEKHRANRKSIV